MSNTSLKKVYQAQLPKAAYREGKEFDSIAYYMAQDLKKKQLVNPTITFCPCHIGSTFDPTKYKGCFHCYKNNWNCCKERTV